MGDWESKGQLLAATLVATLGACREVKPEKMTSSVQIEKGASTCQDGVVRSEAAQTRADRLTPIEYTVSFPAAKRHLVDVAATIPADGDEDVELMMATWTPGSYLIREYARHVQDLVAMNPDGTPLSTVKIAKNRWLVKNPAASQIRLNYRLYAREMSVRTNWVEEDFALLNGAATFITLADGQGRRHEVRMSPPRAWRTTLSGLKNRKDSKLHFKAPDFDALVDGPFLMGNPEVSEFEVDGKAHVLAHLGGDDVWDTVRSKADVERLVRHEADFWGELPYERYVFLNLLTETYGGLEHKNSTVLMFSRWGSRDRAQYLNWLGLVAHEFFHTWNVKRLRPMALGPFDYEHEVHTPSMWVAEGVTSYYDDLFVHRAGLSTENEYLEALGKTIHSVMTGPGRLVQSLAQSSYDAWTKLYRRDENFINSGVNYYSKGALVAWLLDTEIRKTTLLKRSLDDVLREAYARYSGPCGYTEAQFRAVISEVAGRDMGPWLRQHIDEAVELDFASTLSFYGLRFKGHQAKAASGPQHEDPWFDRPVPYTGIQTQESGGRLTVTTVVAGAAGAESGINVGDEIIALAGYRVSPGGFETRLKSFESGSSIEVLVSRRGKLLTKTLTLEASPDHQWLIEVDPDGNEHQIARRKAWLAGSVEKS